MINFPPDLAGKLRSFWPSLRNVVSGISPKTRISSLPDDKTLESLLSISFQASLLSEEQRESCFSIMFGSEAEVRGHNSDVDVVTFSSPLPFLPKEIAGLSPAVDPTVSMMGVGVDGSTLHLGIWGVIHVGSEWWNFTHGRYVSAEPGFDDPPWCLRVSSFRPGQVIISIGAYDCLVLEDGDIYWPGELIAREGVSPISDFFSQGRQSLVKAVSAKLGHPPSFAFVIRSDYDRVLQRLLVQVQQRGHGGAFIFFKEPAIHSILEGLLNIKFPLSNIDWPWARLVATCSIEKEKQNSLERIQSVNRLHDATDFVAGLASVDGAVVISDQFRVMGFGAEIRVGQVGKREVEARRWGYPPGSKRVPISGFGTRHRSAFRLCEVSTDCLVFVFSQDGPVRAVWNDGSDVVMWDRVSPGFFGGLSPDIDEAI